MYCFSVKAVVHEINNQALKVIWYPKSASLYPYVWSILIPSLTERKQFLAHLIDKLQNQIRNSGLENDIEVITFVDDRNYTIGFKRNVLVQQAKGKYVSFIDDDDDVSETYIIDIYDVLKQSPDVVGIKGIHTGGNSIVYFVCSTRFIHPKPSILYLPASDFQWQSDYQFNFKQSKDLLYKVEGRRCYHLNPIRRSIALRFPFSCCSIGEDIRYAVALIKDRALLKNEIMVQKVCYHYCNEVDHSVGCDRLRHSHRIA
jgi:glycosyltransferase involved in cell wall biosynthesis